MVMQSGPKVFIRSSSFLLYTIATRRADMPRKSDGTFDQNKYNSEWSKKNLTTISARYKPDFVKEFKQACKTLGVSQSEIIRTAMLETIEQAQKKEAE